MVGHIFCKIPDKLWVELRDRKVDYGLNWDMTIKHLCDTVEKPLEIKTDYTPYLPSKKMVTVNIQVSNSTEKKFKKFSHMFKGYWHTLDYLIENSRKKGFFME